MKTTAKQSYRNEFSSIPARIDDLIGVSAITNHLCSKTTSRRNKQSGELQRRTQPVPRLWNETLAFTADG
jgi:hypothetical protein